MLPNPVMYRVEPNTKLQLIIPGRRIPEKLTLWMSYQGALVMLQAMLQGVTTMDRDSESVWAVELDVLKMRQGDEPVMYTAEQVAAERAAAAAAMSRAPNVGDAPPGANDQESDSFPNPTDPLSEP